MYKNEIKNFRFTLICGNQMFSSRKTQNFRLVGVTLIIISSSLTFSRYIIDQNSRLTHFQKDDSKQREKTKTKLQTTQKIIRNQFTI